MTFEETLRVMLIKTYIDAYGFEAWDGKSDAEKTETLHELLGSFLAAARKRG